MGKLAIGIFLALSSPAFADYQGVLDLGNGKDPSAIVFRELHDGMWLVGLQQQCWHLRNMRTGGEVFHASVYWATRLEGQDKAYGPSVGVNVGEAAAVAIKRLELLAPGAEKVASSLPPWATKLADWTTIELYAGYRPKVSPDSHHWIYGIGGQVRIPMSMLYAWAKGENGQKGL